jgi:hypothetical protein
MQMIPLQAVPNQTVVVQLDGQNTQINVRQVFTGLFTDISVDNTPLLLGVRGMNLRLMFMNSYLGFVGDLTWFDNQGTSDPFYQGLASRFSLVYMLPSEIPADALYVNPQVS